MVTFHVNLITKEEHVQVDGDTCHEASSLHKTLQVSNGSNTLLHSQFFSLLLST